MTPQGPVNVRPGEPSNRRSLGSSLRPVPTTKAAGPTRHGFSVVGLVAGGVTCIVVGLGMYLILAVLGEPLVGSLALAPCLVMGAVLFVVGERRRGREARVRALARAIAAHLSLRHRTMVEVDARGWTGGWVGTPMIFNIHYPAEVNDSPERWAIDVAEVARMEFGIGYVVGRHNVRHRRLTLRDPRLSGKTSSTPDDERRTDDGKPVNLPTRVDRPRPALDKGRDWLVPIGVDGSGTTVAWDLQNPRAHLLVLGRGGSGKQVAIRGAIMEVATRGWPVWIVDHRRVDMVGLRDWPNVQIVASTLEDQVVVVNQAWREMESRIGLVESGSDRDGLEPLVVVIHPFREFASAVSDWSERAGRGKSGGSVVHDRVIDMLRHGHAVKVFLVLSIGRTDDQLVGADYRDAFGALIALGRIEQDPRSNLWKTPEADLTPFVPGRATVQMGDGEPVQVQCYWTPDPREALRTGNEGDQRIVDQMRPPAAHHPVLYVRRHTPPSGGATVDQAAAWDAAMTGELVESRTGGGEANLAAWSRAGSSRKAVSSAPAAPRTTSGWSEVIMVSQVVPGNLALLDEENGWVIIEQVESVTDPTKIRIQWRGNDGAGTVEFSRTRTVRIRHMNDGVY